MMPTTTNPPVPDIVWSTELDKRYKVIVTRLRPYVGVLTVQDGQDPAARIIHSEFVALAFDAIMGPDVDDVAHWQRLAIAFVDRPKGKEA